MANTQRNFVLGRMNKSLDERLVPNGEYVDALNVRLGSTEASEVGSVETTKGNTQLTTLQYNNENLSSQARCIGAFEDGANETIYWFVHDPYFARDGAGLPTSLFPTGKIDLIVSYNVNDNIVDYHVISVNDGGDVNTTLNFDLKYLITGVDLVENLLFFTDNLNPPRFINVKKGYANPVLSAPRIVDFDNEPLVLQEKLLVIKRPPLFSPEVTLQEVPSAEDNYLEDRFISFAYRYRYDDGEYSATSPFSEPAFIPKDFDFNPNSNLNEGMTNLYNSALVSYNTGGPLVKSIDLLFKEGDNSEIKVIDKFNKKDRGLSNNSTETYTFTNSNIFTVLRDSEILRLYDNVPRFALAQTIMGNRLVYGNYIDGYDLIDYKGATSQIEYTVELVADDISENEVEGSELATTYTIPSRGISNPTDGSAGINIGSFVKDFKAGNTLTFDISFKHAIFAPSGNPQPTSDTGEIDISFSITLSNNYNSVYELATSNEFVNKVGSISPKNINPVYAPLPDPTSCDGITFTDTFNCAIPNNLPSATTSGSVTKYASAISGVDLVGATGYQQNEPIDIVAFRTGLLEDVIFFKLPYMRFVNDVNVGTDTSEDIYEFYEVTFASATIRTSPTIGSLHSNRGYETGIVYMDDFGRSSTALVSNNNSLHIPCSSSKNRNYIQVDIPPRQIAPEWATHYKFVIKPDEENYDVIYSSIYYRTADANYAYFFLEGENSQKIEVGDRLIVKKDSSGPTTSCVYVTVLEKKVYAENEIEDGSLVGAYMKVGTNQLSITEQENASVLYGLQRAEYGNDTQYGFIVDYPSANPPGPYPLVTYPMSVLDGAGNYVDYTVPFGSRVGVNLNFYRTGKGNTKKRTMFLSVFMQASRDYDNMFEFLIGENFQGFLNRASFEGENNSNFFYPTAVAAGIQPIQPSENQNIFWYTEGNGTTIPSYLNMNGTVQDGIKAGKRSVAIATIDVYRADGVVIFESEPQDALPDVWYESADTYETYTYVDPVTLDEYPGRHKGNSQDQTNVDSAVVNTDFMNCYAFGNGAESYKIRDSIVGKSFNLGNRVFTTSEQEYKEAHRFADLTYSGVYNEESNINKLNEFNLGLLNFKPLERTFGPIQILSGRETDILTLQEDKISYVLQGKNLLSDAGAGTALTSVPEVLGKQIARVEDYGISNHPESFIQWGKDKYFTDAKRGAVLQLKGSSAQNEQLNIISEQGMRSWFRDLFIDSFETQKLGGFDPYMNEYVLSSNNTPKPVVTDCIDCGIIVGNIVVDVANSYDFCVDVGDLVGDVTIDIDIDSSVSGNNSFRIDYTYAGVTNTYFSATTPISDTITIQKSSVADQKITLVVENSSTNKSYIRGITVGCPEAETITIIPISITSDAINGEYIHSEYSWTDGTFVSPLHSRLVSFDNDNTTEFVISDYDQITGLQGAGVIPADSATVSMICNKINYDNFVFSEGVISPLPTPPTPNNFRYLRTNTRYYNTIADIKLLLAETLTDPDGGVPAIDSTDAPDKYSATFAMPNTGAYLYLIWDYRLSTEDDLCFGATIEDACCTC